MIVLGLLLGMVALGQLGSSPTQAASPTSDLQITVASARTEPMANGGAGVLKGDPIANFKYLINVDNTGQNVDNAGNPQRNANPGSGCSAQDPGYPTSCNWTSMGANSSAPIYTQGDQRDFPLRGLPAGRYLISVLADGYKLDGVHFTIPLADNTPLAIELEPTPLATATIQAQVFQDNRPTNSAPDLPAEHGLQGFTGQIRDYLGLVTTDVFGNPLCTHYTQEFPPNTPGHNPYDLNKALLNAPDFTPTPIAGSGGNCYSDANGVLRIPNLGPNRYTLTAVAPDGTSWVQTTTLEGNHDWDAWVMEGATGLDTEFVQGGEAFPAIVFGFVCPTGLSDAPLPADGACPSNAPVRSGSSGSGEIKGVVDGVHVYVPAKGGLAQTNGQIFGGLTGTKLDKPIVKPWLTLTALTGNAELDTMIYAGQGGADGTFDIKNVPAGNYSLTWWDEPQNYILDSQNITVAASEVIDMGVLPLNGWWTYIDGYVFNDTNRNGVRDPGEAGVPNYTITMRKRENSLMDRGATLVTTDANGYYKMENAYPITQWLVEEAYNESYYTTGVTYQTDNQPAPTTTMGAGVDVSVLPIIGLSATLDWGVHAYDPTGATAGADPRNGGIVGTVSYDTTRNETDPRFAVAEDWQPGISGLPVDLYSPKPCSNTPGVPCSTDPGPKYELNPDGSYAKAKLLYTYVTETWQQPTGCIARDVDGNPLIPVADENVVPADNSGDPTKNCLEGPLMGNQFQSLNSVQNGFSTVNGNYGFSEGCFAPGVLDNTNPDALRCTDPTNANADVPFTALPGGKDYLVDVRIPADAAGKPLYKVDREEDVNIGNGDQFLPQALPPACAGPLHTVDLLGSGTDNYGVTPVTKGLGVIDVPASTPTDNPTFPAGGSPYEGQQKPLCQTKLVRLNNGKSATPIFNMFTDVPLPGRFWGLIVDDLNFSTDTKSLLVGEKAGVPFAPVGIYDYANRLEYTTESDYNGLFDVLMPSTNRINCPTPSGVCGNLYRFVGNDPGVPGRLNLNFKPQFRTIAAEFEALPGLLVPADLAPTQVGVTVQLPGGQFNQVNCSLNAPGQPADTATPEIFSVSKPYAYLQATAVASETITISGHGFGSTKGSGAVLLDVPSGTGTTLLTTTNWSDTQITFTVPSAANAGSANAGAGVVGARNLHVIAANGMKTVNGLTFHILGGAYQPTLYLVGAHIPADTNVPAAQKFVPVNSLPDVADHAIQKAIDAAAASAANDLVVVYPGLTDTVNPRNNPRGAYYENLIINRPVKLQGSGPGGSYTDANGQPVTVDGAIIDGSAFAGDSAVTTDWYNAIGGLTWTGNQNIYDGAVISLYPRTANLFAAAATAGFPASIDGLDVRGGDQQGFPNNLNAIGGGSTGLPANNITQGGAIFANASANGLLITNNIVQNNGGAYGTIRLGTADLPAPGTSNHNENVKIKNNRIFANAGTNLAGGIGLFNGSDNYEIANNDICGNFSAEYGGGISALGYSPGGKIHDNRVYFNASYDEGGGITIAGALPANAAIVSPGSGPVDIYNNLIQGNLGNDDGGGVRFLMAGNFPINVYNNVIVNNVSTHEGGGVAINDTPQVNFYNNTVMKNITTATAATSDGTPAPAGLSTSLNSAPLQNTLAAGAATFSDPNLFNNIFWDNRAGARAGGTVSGIGLVGDSTPVNNWDMGNADGLGGLLSPTNTLMQVTTGTIGASTNIVNVDPGVANVYDSSVSFKVWRNNPAFVGAVLVAVDLPANLLGNYHLKDATSPAVDKGAAAKGAVLAPTFDFENSARPALIGYDIGADEVTASPDVAVAVTDGRASVQQGGPVTYTIRVTKALALPVLSGVSVVDTPPAGFAAETWSCTASGTSTCGAAGTGAHTGAVNTTVDLGGAGVGNGVFITVSGTVSPSATPGAGQFVYSATVAPPSGQSDPAPSNNTATDTDAVVQAADLSITKTDAKISVTAATANTYTIIVTNNSPNTVTGARVTDPMPAAFTGVSWTCTATGGSCTTPNGTGSFTNRLVTLTAGGTATFTVTGTISPSATGSLVNTATVTNPAGVVDPVTTNNSATDNDTVVASLCSVLDCFNGGAANNLGVNWSQGAGTVIRVNANQANNAAGVVRTAMWNNPAAGYGSAQTAGFAFVATGLNNDALILKGSGGTPDAPANYVLVQYQAPAAGSRVRVFTVVNGVSSAFLANFPSTFAAGDTLSASVNASGVVTVLKNGVPLGTVPLTNPLFTSGGGRIGIQLPNGGRIDDFSGGNS